MKKGTDKAQKKISSKIAKPSSTTMSVRSTSRSTRMTNMRTVSMLGLAEKSSACGLVSRKKGLRDKGGLQSMRGVGLNQCFNDSWHTSFFSGLFCPCFAVSFWRQTGQGASPRILLPPPPPPTCVIFLRTGRHEDRGGDAPGGRGRDQTENRRCMSGTRIHRHSKLWCTHINRHV